jgi:hypothetical protein
MSSSDIYEVKEPPWAKKAEPPKKRRRQRRQETFDEVVNRDLSATHRRHSRNSGFRRLRHRLKKYPQFSKKFWISTLGSAGLILVLLIVWDMFFRYPDPLAKPAPAIPPAEVK